MQLLLKQRRPDVQITPWVIEAIAQHFDGKIIQLRLEKEGGRCPGHAQVTPQVVVAAAENRRRWSCSSKQRGADVQIAPQVLEAIAQHFDGVVLTNRLLVVKL
jgi:hypothetical protein